jgi:hypothetical protein
MTCDEVKNNASLFLYGELPLEDEQIFQDHLDSCPGCRRAFEAEKRIHDVLNAREMLPTPELLVRCRRDLAVRTGTAAPRRSWLAGLLDLRLAALARPAGALALIALGFFAARWTAPSGSPLRLASNEPSISRVRSLQPDASGRLQLVIDETRQRVVTGSPDDPRIRPLLVAAARESTDPVIRAESMDVLNTPNSAAQIKPLLLYALQHDSNPGVRLKALDALKPLAADSEVQETLARVLLADDNPGVRAQAIDLLVQHKDDASIPVLQQLVQKENNGYVRLRCQRALEEMNASVGTF